MKELVGQCIYPVQKPHYGGYVHVGWRLWNEPPMVDGNHPPLRQLHRLLWEKP